MEVKSIRKSEADFASRRSHRKGRVWQTLCPRWRPWPGLVAAHELVPAAARPRGKRARRLAAVAPGKPRRRGALRLMVALWCAMDAGATRIRGRGRAYPRVPAAYEGQRRQCWRIPDRPRALKTYQAGIQGAASANIVSVSLSWSPRDTDVRRQAGLVEVHAAWRAVRNSRQDTLVFILVEPRNFHSIVCVSRGEQPPHSPCLPRRVRAECASARS